ncbi:hypothetical protein SAICODRAFT_72824 [Saitoella complicata NRRL Y-17804]|uniref:Uncharacterized protein n=1 Tax=Saitoella complicata (strain BCRC 22490 / CBS 7301 / JCM 7358 / NBRC 10748 / NRRL Y-17804) TaxID=698492 RepID=A0A0E9NHV1_SAICN|nr:uncharacterized protein SAICODRAFT_72824 [Saitoella complicata NRRL Y-17804]ODQ51219.1 hypothetical protein SAICODRAFT_72824 [Saitoella complicata NRRL Y-17804]GAO49281.1 hypothetical protein G7K_3433-t1 [Saitoella complicata NRRL Y-17804]
MMLNQSIRLGLRSCPSRIALVGRTSAFVPHAQQHLHVRQISWLRKLIPGKSAEPKSSYVKPAKPSTTDDVPEAVVLYRGDIGSKIAGYKAASTSFLVVGYLAAPAILFTAQTPMSGLLAMLASCTMPLLICHAFGSAYVMRVSVLPPDDARKNRKAFNAYMAEPEGDMPLVLETLGLFGQIKKTGVRLSELEPTKKRFATWQRKSDGKKFMVDKEGGDPSMKWLHQFVEKSSGKQVNEETKDPEHKKEEKK